MLLAAGSCLARNYAAAGVHRGGMRFWDAQKVWCVTLSKLVVLAWLLHRYVFKQLHKLRAGGRCGSRGAVSANAGPYARARVGCPTPPRLNIGSRTLGLTPSPSSKQQRPRLNLRTISDERDGPAAAKKEE